MDGTSNGVPAQLQRLFEGLKSPDAGVRHDSIRGMVPHARDHPDSFRSFHIPALIDAAAEEALRGDVFTVVAALRDMKDELAAFAPLAVTELESGSWSMDEACVLLAALASSGIRLDVSRVIAAVARNLLDRDGSPAASTLVQVYRLDPEVAVATLLEMLGAGGNRREYSARAILTLATTGSFERVVGLRVVDSCCDALLRTPPTAVAPSPAVWGVLARALGALIPLDPVAMAGKVLGTATQDRYEEGRFTAVFRCIDLEGGASADWIPTVTASITDGDAPESLRWQLADDVEFVTSRHPAALWPYFAMLLEGLERVLGECMVLARSGGLSASPVGSVLTRLTRIVVNAASVQPKDAIQQLTGRLEVVRSGLIWEELFVVVADIAALDIAEARAFVPRVMAAIELEDDGASQWAAIRAAATLVHAFPGVLPGDLLELLAWNLRSELPSLMLEDLAEIFTRARLTDRAAPVAMNGFSELLRETSDRGERVPMRKITQAVHAISGDHPDTREAAADALAAACASADRSGAETAISAAGLFGRWYSEHQKSLVVAVLKAVERHRLPIAPPGGRRERWIELLAQSQPSVLRQSHQALTNVASAEGTEPGFGQMAGLFQLLGEYGDTSTLLQKAAVVASDEVRRLYLAACAECFVAEVCVLEGKVDEASARWRRCKRYLRDAREAGAHQAAVALKEPGHSVRQRNRADGVRNTRLERWVDFRLDWLVIMARLPKESELDNLVETLSEIGAWGPDGGDASARASVHSILEAARAVIRWDSVVGTTEGSALAVRTRDLVAKAGAVHREGRPGVVAFGDSYRSVVRAIERAQETGGLDDVVRAFRLLPFPVPRLLTGAIPRWDFPLPAGEVLPQRNARREPEATDRSLRIALLLNAEPAGVIYTVTAGVTYDLTAQINVPPGMEGRLSLEVSASAPPEMYVCRFDPIDLPGDHGTHLMSGHLLIKHSQAPGSLPYRFRLVPFLAARKDTRIHVLGDDELTVSAAAGGERSIRESAELGRTTAAGLAEPSDEDLAVGAFLGRQRLVLGVPVASSRSIGVEFEGAVVPLGPVMFHQMLVLVRAAFVQPGGRISFSSAPPGRGLEDQGPFSRSGIEQSLDRLKRKFDEHVGKGSGARLLRRTRLEIGLAIHPRYIEWDEDQIRESVSAVALKDFERLKQARARWVSKQEAE